MLTQTKKVFTNALLAAMISAFPATQSFAADAVVEEEPAFDEEAVKLRINGHVGFFSDYRFRGVSLSDEEPVLQGSLVASIGGFYFGAWSSPITLPEGDVEIDLFTGYNFSLPSDTTLTLQAAYITFPGEPDSSFFRATAGISKDFDGLFTLGAKVDYEPEQDDTFLELEDNIYISGSFSSQIAEFDGNPLTLTAGIGYEDGAFADEKVDWLVGLTQRAYGLDWSVQYIDTNIDSPTTDATAVFSVVKNF